jgi:hypothetical protein
LALGEISTDGELADFRACRRHGSRLPPLSHHVYRELIVRICAEAPNLHFLDVAHARVAKHRKKRHDYESAFKRTLRA